MQRFHQQPLESPGPTWPAFSIGLAEKLLSPPVGNIAMWLFVLLHLMVCWDCHCPPHSQTPGPVQQGPAPQVKEVVVGPQQVHQLEVVVVGSWLAPHPYE